MGVELLVAECSDLRLPGRIQTVASKVVWEFFRFLFCYVYLLGVVSPYKNPVLSISVL